MAIQRTTRQDSFESSESRSPAQSGLLPEDLDEPFLYTFQPNDLVWVRAPGGEWHEGRVARMSTHKGQTRKDEGVFYPVVYRKNIRRYFAPLNGDIKPDDGHVRGLLEEAGFL